jgi:hypothetical protein
MATAFMGFPAALGYRGKCVGSPLAPGTGTPRRLVTRRLNYGAVADKQADPLTAMVSLPMT